MAAARQPGDVDTSQEAHSEAAIMDLSAQWSQSYLNRDVSILERIWAKEFVYVEPSGHRFDKAEGIAALAASTDRLAASAASTIDVRVYGGGTVAVDVGDYRERGRDEDGVEFERASRFTNVWVLRDGRWQCVSGQASVIP